MDRYNPPSALTMKIALAIMFNTLRPILIPETILDTSYPNTQAEFGVKQIATQSFWAFTSSAFGFALVAALVQIWSRAAHGSRDRLSFKLVMVAMICMSVSSKCLMIARQNPFWLIMAFSFVEGLPIMLTLVAYS